LAHDCPFVVRCAGTPFVFLNTQKSAEHSRLLRVHVRRRDGFPRSASAGVILCCAGCRGELRLEKKADVIPDYPYTLGSSD
jgi:hypothetical protein